MSFTCAVRATARQTSIRSIPKSTSSVASLHFRRYLNTETAPVLYSANATVTGGRNGKIQGSEGLKVELAMPKSMGGPGGAGKTNPEELFAACYGSCFQSAMNLTAKGLGVLLPEEAEDSIVETTVHMVGDLKKLDLGVRVDIVVKICGVPKAEVEKVVAKTKEICPYSRATKGNVITNIEVVEL